MKRFLVIIFSCVVGLSPLLAQKYGTALGLRFGNSRYRTIGITVDQRLFKHITVEGILQSDFNRNTTVHGIVKRHFPILTKRINLFTGIGMSVGNEESIEEDPVSRTVVTTYDNTTLGTDLMLGAEITLLGINVGLDYKPNLNLIGRENWYQGQVGISVRTVLIKDKERKKKKRKRERQKRRKERRKEREKQQENN